ncbi:uncharacterized protein LOC134763659 [Penaeus indicus]|uniref:uncharacterized protein LOC134763659 n=1 Tax=Penaeus indicus TaxID=29960 RepID=UPI00300D1E59
MENRTTRQEVITALKMMNGKSTRPDGIPVELLERILDSRLRQVVHIGRHQLGFMKGVGTVDGIFSLRQTMEKHHEKQKVLHMAFIDLEKAYDSVPRQEVGLHQGSALSPLLFNIVFDVINENVREDPPWCILYANYIVLVAESRRTLERKLEEWRVALESRGMRISKSKTEYFTTDTSDDQQATIKLNGIELKRVKSFRSVVDETVGMERKVNFRIQCGWNNWKKVSGVICDKRVPVRLKGSYEDYYQAIPKLSAYFWPSMSYQSLQCASDHDTIITTPNSGIQAFGKLLCEEQLSHCLPYSV